MFLAEFSSKMGRMKWSLSVSSSSSSSLMEEVLWTGALLCTWGLLALPSTSSMLNIRSSSMTSAAVLTIDKVHECMRYTLRNDHYYCLYIENNDSGEIKTPEVQLLTCEIEIDVCMLICEPWQERLTWKTHACVHVCSLCWFCKVLAGGLRGKAE